MYFGEIRLQSFADSKPSRVKCPPIGISKISIFLSFSKINEQGIWPKCPKWHIESLSSLYI